LTFSSISSHSRLTWLFEMPVMPNRLPQAVNSASLCCDRLVNLGSNGGSGLDDVRRQEATEQEVRPAQMARVTRSRTPPIPGVRLFANPRGGGTGAVEEFKLNDEQRKRLVLQEQL
jgi:hypothetical protein